MLGRNGQSEGHARHARRSGMDDPTWYSGPDEQVPPSGRDKRVPPKVGGHAYHARSIAYRRQPPKPRPSPP
jgi:hypothetical protein